jgi:NitT/TauT family transport system substrate-binding protein
MKTLRVTRWLAAAAAFYAATSAVAETSTIRTGRGPGFSFLPIYIVQHEKLIEKHAAALGLGQVKVEFAEQTSGQVMNEALLSGNMEFATGGVPPFLILWSRTFSSPREVRAVAAVSANPSYLNTRNSEVKTIRDFTAKDRISVAAVRASQVAILLQMAAEKEFGPGQHGKLDELTVSMPQPESVAALLSGRSEITAHFTVAPFHQAEIKDPAIRTVLRSRDVLGGIGTVVVAYTTAKFRSENPKTVQAYYAALAEAGAFIHDNPRRTAEIYKSMTPDRMSVEELEGLLRDPDYSYRAIPQKTQVFADFMHRIGSLPRRPETWKDLFFPEIHGEPGN